MASKYRIKIDIRYSSTANATTATTNINNILVSNGRSEVATRTSADVLLLIVGISTESEATTLINALRPAWSGVARTYGKVSVVRTDDLD